jgi:hypothetical protein
MASQEVPEKELVLLKTRPGVLVRFFQKSRDRWKEKCQQVRGQLKALLVRIRDLERSRAAWRTRAEQHEQELRQLQQELAQLQCAAAAAPQEPEQKPSHSFPRRRCRGTSFRRSRSTLS